MKTTTRTLSILTPLAVALLVGCAHPPSLVKAHYGDSVRQLISEQTADPGAVNRPIEAATLNGPQGEAVMDNYHTDVAKPEEVSNDIIFNIGN